MLLTLTNQKNKKCLVKKKELNPLGKQLVGVLTLKEFVKIKNVQLLKKKVGPSSALENSIWQSIFIKFHVPNVNTD